jgi:tetratricopeptide (TPR) repeat protein
MLEMLREYAAEMLALEDNESLRGEDDESRMEERRETEAVTLGRYHAEYFLVIAEEAETKLLSAEQTKWLDMLEVEHANISAAIQWYARMGEYEGGLRIAAAIWRFWWMRGPVREGHAYLQRLLADASLKGAQTEVSPRVRGRALTGYAYMLTLSSDYEEGIVYAQEAVDALRSIGDEQSLAEALNVLGLFKYYVDDVAEALVVLSESVAIRRKLGDTPGLARSLANLAEAMRYQGSYDEANELYAEALSICLLDTKDEWGASMAFHNLAQVAIHQGNYGRAASLLEEGFSLQGTRDTKQSVALYLALLGRLLLELGEQQEILKESARLLAACTSLLESIGITIEKVDLLNYEHALEIVHGGLSEDDFEQASEEGRNLTYAQAVDFAGKTIHLLRENERSARRP